MRCDIRLQCRPVSPERIRWIPRRRGPQKADTPDLIISFKEEYSALRERERSWQLATFFRSHSYSLLEPCFSILSPHHILHFPFVLPFFIISPLLRLIIVLLLSLCIEKRTALHRFSLWWSHCQFFFFLNSSTSYSLFLSSLTPKLFSLLIFQSLSFLILWLDEWAYLGREAYWRSTSS